MNSQLLSEAITTLHKIGKGNKMNAATAFQIFKEINIESTVTLQTIYWTGLDAEREGCITVQEMDAISVYHKRAILQMHNEDQAWIEAEAKEMAEVHKAMNDYWEDEEAAA